MRLIINARPQEWSSPTNYISFDTIVELSNISNKGARVYYKKKDGTQGQITKYSGIECDEGIVFNVTNTTPGPRAEPTLNDRIYTILRNNFIDYLYVGRGSLDFHDNQNKIELYLSEITVAIIEEITDTLLGDNKNIHM